MKPTKHRSLLVACSAALLVWLACASSSREVDLSGVSSTTVTASRGLHFTATGPITFPESYPAIGGLSLEEGVEIDIELEPGESVVLDDETDADGNITVTGVNEVDQRLARATTAEPAPAGTVTMDLTIRPSSTYTWRVPALFGDTPATVSVTGSVHAVASASALIEDDDGGGTLDPSGLESLSYSISGPPAVWQAPIKTPYGTIEGTGTIATSTSMLIELGGALSAVSGSASPGYLDPDGLTWDYSYDAALPVRLSAGSGVAYGTTTVTGGIDLF